jgi:HNH endonuclease
MTAIADLVALLVSSGMPAATIASAIDLAQQHAIETVDIHRIPPEVRHDSASERRKAWDRDRKRFQRGLRLSEGEWIPLVVKILERDGNSCTYCGTNEGLTADHVVPLTRGGTNDESNLTACCISCNTKKSNKLVSEWLPAASVRFHADVHPNPPYSQESLLYLDSSKKDSIKKESKKEPTAKKKLVPLPLDWRPPDIAYPLAAECGTTVPHVEAIFRDYLKSSAKLYASHDAAFCNFIRNQRKYDQKRHSGVKWNGFEGVV